MRSAALLLAFSACSAPTGKVTISVTPEDTITEGLQPGDQEENMRDGWTVTYSKFLVTLGNFNAKSTASGATLTDTNTYVIDLGNAPSSGVSVSTWDNAVAEVRYDQFGYSLTPASAGSQMASGVNSADFALMTSNGYSLYFRGEMQKGDRTITFNWGFKGGTALSNCGAEGQDSGFAVTAGQTTTVEPTIHGDHWFFTNSPHSTTPDRLAEWISTCDDNGDNDVTLDEIAAHSAQSLFPTAKGYNLSSLPIKPINTGFDYFAAQARTLGHFQGDGDCEGLAITSTDPREPKNIAVTE